MGIATGRSQVAITIEHDRLACVAASVTDQSVRVRKWVSAERPDGVDPKDAAAVGKWIREELKRADLLTQARRSGVAFSVSRGEVVLKRLTLPPGTSEGDLPGMVRLQMVRQLTVSSDDAAIDFVPIDSDGAGGAGDGSAGPTVLAAALQGDRVAWSRAVARAAGIRLRRIALGSEGVAALLAESSQRRHGAMLGISLAPGSTEFVVVEGGRIVFARATDLDRSGAGADTVEFARKVTVEAKRTWMSFRVTHEVSEIEAVAVLGSDSLSCRVAEMCEEALELPAEATDVPAMVEAPDRMTPEERSALASLMGVLAGPVVSRHALNFLSPRRPPDPHEAMRQRVLVGALAVILLAGGLYTYKKITLGRLQSRLHAAQQHESKEFKSYVDFTRLQARADHADRWLKAKVNWLDHVAFLNARLPEPSQALLDEISGRCSVDLKFSPPQGRKGPFEYAAGRWRTDLSATMRLAGSVKERSIADALRESIVDDNHYLLQTRGADTPTRFDWNLTSNETAPHPAKADTPPEGSK